MFARVTEPLKFSEKTTGYLLLLCMERKIIRLKKISDLDLPEGNVINDAAYLNLLYNMFQN